MEKRGLFTAGVLIVILIALLVISIEREAASPESVVSDFYSLWYEYAGTQAGLNPITDRVYRTSSYVSERFVNETDEFVDSFSGEEYDPVWCAEDVPSAFVVGMSSIMEEELVAHVPVYMDFYGTKREVEVVLVEHDGLWRIEEIKCGARESDEQAVRHGYLVREIPGLASGVWHLIHEEPGMPASNIPLSFKEMACDVGEEEIQCGAAVFSAGMRVDVFGRERGGEFVVTSIEVAEVD